MILQYCVVQRPPLQAAQTMGETRRLSGALKTDWQWRTRACSNGRTAGRSDEYYLLPDPKELLAFPPMLCDCSFRAQNKVSRCPSPGHVLTSSCTRTRKEDLDFLVAIVQRSHSLRLGKEGCRLLLARGFGC